MKPPDTSTEAIISPVNTRCPHYSPRSFRECSVSLASDDSPYWPPLIQRATAQPMIPFMAAGAIVLWAVNAGANAMMQCKFDPLLPLLWSHWRHHNAPGKVANASLHFSGRVQERSPKSSCEAERNQCAKIDGLSTGYGKHNGHKDGERFKV